MHHILKVKDPNKVRPSEAAMTLVDVIERLNLAASKYASSIEATRGDDDNEAKTKALQDAAREFTLWYDFCEHKHRAARKAAHSKKR